MTKRETTLMKIVGVAAFVFVGYFVVNKTVIGKFSKLKSDITKAENINASLSIYNQQELLQEQKAQQFAEELLGQDEGELGETLRIRIDALMNKSRLSTADRVFTKIRASRIKGSRYDQVIGWKVSAMGRLADIVDFLYLLDREPYIHKISDVILNKNPNGTIEVSLNYTTLIMASSKTLRVPRGKVDPDNKFAELGDDEHQPYSIIASRDITSPYVPKRPPTPTHKPPVKKPPIRNTTPPPRAAATFRHLKVVSLSYFEKDEVMVQNLNTRKIEAYQAGDECPIGKIVMIDRREMPSAIDPGRKSSARLIIQIGKDYWAIDNGQILDDKRKLTHDQLPESLK